MDDKELLLEQYRIYTESKERYIDRTFLINRFYIIFVSVFFAIMLFLKTFQGGAFLALAGVELFGIMLCVMWFSNQDAYSTIIKIKYSAVLEKMETQLPYTPLKDEYEELQTQRKNKQIILVKDFQKWFAISILLLFTANLLLDMTSLILVSYVHP